VLFIIMMPVCDLLVTLWQELRQPIFLEGIFGLTHILQIKLSFGCLNIDLLLKRKFLQLLEHDRADALPVVDSVRKVGNIDAAVPLFEVIETLQVP
jgi:hypothetical protein